MAAVTLDAVVAQLKADRNTSEKAHGETTELLEEQNKLLDTLISKFEAWLDRDAADRLQALNRGLRGGDGGRVVPGGARVTPSTREEGANGNLRIKDLLSLAAPFAGFAALIGFLGKDGPFAKTLKNAFKNFRTGLSERLKLFRERFAKLLKTFRVEFVKSLKTFGSNVAGTLNNFRTAFAERLKTFRTNLAETLKRFRLNFADTLKQFRLNLAESFKNFRVTLVERLNTWRNGFGTMLDEKLRNFKAGFALFFGDLFERLKFKFSLAKLEFKSSNLGMGLQNVLDEIRSRINNIKFDTKFQEKFDKFKERWANIKTRLLTVPTWMTTNVINPISNFLDEFKVKANARLENLMRTVSEKWERLKGSGLGKFFGLVGRILRPIAIIFSALDGFREAERQIQEVENDPNKAFLEKLVEGTGGLVAGFFGTFVGGFFDLIKGGILFVLKKAFPGLVDENGEFKTEGFFGRMLKNIDEFSFMKIITDSINGIFQVISDSITWLRQKFGAILTFFGLDDMPTEEEIQRRRDALYSEIGGVSNIEPTERRTGALLNPQQGIMSQVGRDRPTASYNPSVVMEAFNKNTNINNNNVSTKTQQFLNLREAQSIVGGGGLLF